MGTGSPYELLEVEMWHALLTRAVIFRAVASRLGEWSDATQDPKRYGTSAKTALQLLQETCQAIATKEGIEDSDAVASVAQQWLTAVEGLASTATTADGRRLLAELHALVLEHAVADDPFKLMFDAVVTRSRGLYAGQWRAASLSVLHLPEHPRPPADRDPYAVTATTEVDQDLAEIELQICPALFGPESYAAIPMILVHECVCHVAARQRENDNASLFAEGFLDWTAIFFLHQWIAELDGELAPAALHHAERLAGIMKELGRTAAAQRIQGHRAADTLSTWFQNALRRPLPEADVKVARLAVELNMADSELQRKDQFVSELRMPLAGDLEELLRKWERGAAPAIALLERPLAALP